MTTFVLPWPPVKLSPNAKHKRGRGGKARWRMKAEAADGYRRACWISARGQGGMPGKVTGPQAVEVIFRPPDRRSYDRDNLLARIKSGLDGMCEALEIDDKTFRRLTTEVSDEPVLHGEVVVELTPMVPA